MSNTIAGIKVRAHLTNKDLVVLKCADKAHLDAALSTFKVTPVERVTGAANHIAVVTRIDLYDHLPNAWGVGRNDCVVHVYAAAKGVKPYAL